MTPAIYSTLAELIRQGRAASIATVIQGSGVRGQGSVKPPAPDSRLPTPSDSGHETWDLGLRLQPGAKMLIMADGAPNLGSIHPNLDSAIVADAHRLLPLERSEIVAYETPSGPVEVFIESFPPPQRLVIVGAVHVAIPLSKMASILGYRVTVVDPRGVFATPVRFPEAETLLVEWPDEAFPKLNVNTSTSIVVLTHDPKIDLPAVIMGLNSPAQYVGAIGSRTTIQQRKTDLAEMGATQEQLDRLHAPIGLRIGSRTPAEIALAIMAEIVSVRRGLWRDQKAKSSRQ